MRVLQLTSDWKWTGPAAPMLELLRALRDRGIETDLSCPDPPPEATTSLRGAAEAHAIKSIPGDVLDFRRYDVVHAWHTRDHLQALRASWRRRRAGGTRVLRSYARAERIPRTPWNRWLFGPGTDGLLCVSPRTLEMNRGIRGGRPIAWAFGAVDLERFQPAPPSPQMRARLGLAPEHRVVGIAARVQPQRRFDLLWAAFAKLAARDARARLLVLGRGTKIREVGIEPAHRMGLADRTIFAGHRTQDYVDCLRTVDVFTLLVPGSDGGCRAVQEAAACGIPAVVTRRGALPELVRGGETGFVVDEDPDALAGAWSTCFAEPARRAALGRAARRHAERSLDRRAFAEAWLGLIQT